MKKKRLLHREMVPIVDGAFQNTLKAYKWPKLPAENLILGAEITPTEGIFELYFCAERPDDAVVISNVIIDRFTGEVLKMEVFLEKLEVEVPSPSKKETE